MQQKGRGKKEKMEMTQVCFLSLSVCLCSVVAEPQKFDRTGITRRSMRPTSLHPLAFSLKCIDPTSRTDWQLGCPPKGPFSSTFYSSRCINLGICHRKQQMNNSHCISGPFWPAFWGPGRVSHGFFSADRTVLPSQFEMQKVQWVQ